MDKPTKQIIVIRKDLKMRRGKEIAQGCHASMAFLTRREGFDGQRPKSLSKAQQEWLQESYKKVCVVVETEEALLDLEQKAIAAGLECHVITDSGATEFHGVPTKTCLAIGPDYDEKIDPITKDLKLY